MNSKSDKCVQEWHLMKLGRIYEIALHFFKWLVLYVCGLKNTSVNIRSDSQIIMNVCKSVFQMWIMRHTFIEVLIDTRPQLVILVWCKYKKIKTDVRLRVTGVYWYTGILIYWYMITIKQNQASHLVWCRHFCSANRLLVLQTWAVSIFSVALLYIKWLKGK